MMRGGDGSKRSGQVIPVSWMLEGTTSNFCRNSRHKEKKPDLVGLQLNKDLCCEALALVVVVVYISYFWTVEPELCLILMQPWKC